MFITSSAIVSVAPLLLFLKGSTLPDSNRNEPASHGFVQFSVSPVPQTLLGTIIRNRASIYFDFNSPVLTNTVLHTVDTGFIRPKPEPPVYKPDARIYFTPNPAGQSSWVSLEFCKQKKTHRLQLYDVHGREVRSVIMPQSPFLDSKTGVARRGLPGGYPDRRQTDCCGSGSVQSVSPSAVRIYSSTMFSCP